MDRLTNKRNWEKIEKKNWCFTEIFFATLMDKKYEKRWFTLRTLCCRMAARDGERENRESESRWSLRYDLHCCDAAAVSAERTQHNLANAAHSVTIGRPCSVDEPTRWIKSPEKSRQSRALSQKKTKVNLKNWSSGIFFFGVLSFRE